jgi:hypothetical protein
LADSRLDRSDFFVIENPKFFEMTKFIDAHAHCGIQDQSMPHTFDDYRSQIQNSGIEAVVMFSTVLEIYDRYRPNFDDNDDWKQRRKTSNCHDELISFIEGPDVMKKILKHLGLWEVKRKLPRTVANAPPIDVFPAYDEQPGPSSDDYIKESDLCAPGAILLDSLSKSEFLSFSFASSTSRCYSG